MIVVDDIRTEISNGKLVPMLMDIHKAFDTVGDAALLEKLEVYMIRDLGLLTIWWNHTQLVQVNNALFSPFSLKSGGVMLGPLMFIIQIT